MVPERDTTVVHKITPKKDKLSKFLPKKLKGFPSMLDSHIEGINLNFEKKDNGLEQVLVDLDEQLEEKSMNSKIWINNMERDFDTMTNPDIQSTINM